MPCGPSKRHLDMYHLGDKFMNQPEVKALFANPSDLVTKKYYQLFGFKPSEWKAFQPSGADVRKFKQELKYMLKQIRKDKVAGGFASNLYTTSGVVRRNPLLGELYDNYLHINHEYKGRQIIQEQDFLKVMGHLKDEATITGMLGGSGTFKKATKRARDLESNIEKLLIDSKNNVPGADVKLSKAMGKLDRFLAKGEGKIFKDFVELVESPTKGLRSIPEVQDIIKDRLGKGLTDKNIKDIKTAIINSGITKSANMQNALSKYVETMHSQYNTLVNGVTAYIKGQQEAMIAKGVTDVKALEEVRMKLLDKFLPDEKAGYYPHFRYDLNSLFLDGLMPRLQKLSESTTIGKEGGIDAAINDLNVYVSSRTKKRTKNLDSKMYSMNFPVVMKRYMDEINRFNYVAHTQMNTMKTLREARNAFAKGKDLEGYGAQLVEMIKDLNQSQMGTKEIQSDFFRNASRAILNMEFTSKLGFNVRSAARNATQGLLNFVEFGTFHMRKSREFYRNEEMSRLVDKAMDESGIRFTEMTPELLETTGGKGVFNERVKFDSGGEIIFKNPSKMSQFADFTGKIAGLSGKATMIPKLNMMNIENANRKMTYRFAFSKMYMQLNTSSGFRRMMMDKFQKTRKRDMTDAEFNAELFKRSRNYAERMTTLLHFDYSTVSKSKIMRSPIGRFMFQFQHYSHKFAEYNFRILRNAKHGLMAGEIGWNGEMGKAYRMGIAYAMVPALLSAFTKNDWFRMIQHDTAQRIGQWWTFFTGDEEEFEKATYGRGAIGGMIGFPVLSDALALAELTELWDLSDADWLRFAIGYNDMAGVSGDQKIAKLASIANIQAGRILYHTGPIALRGGIGTALQHEMGIYPTARAKDMQENVGRVLPKAIGDALDRLDIHISKARKKKVKPSGF
ncbi:MAG: hypothetical protein Tp152DCM46671_23 [Prokaryotic dsDNA virus sp.]|nr:MAG: hypothetical protein Tp152DCM46671_23 [Prokaryotic dsDNA virus sp.]|tara:strand:- start:10521 stop:13229 length:2709 start_codon:yes stop_codon:yes gene_type:complete